MSWHYQLAYNKQVNKLKKNITDKNDLIGLIRQDLSELMNEIAIMKTKDTKKAIEVLCDLSDKNLVYEMISRKLIGKLDKISVGITLKGLLQICPACMGRQKVIKTTPKRGTPMYKNGKPIEKDCPCCHQTDYVPMINKVQRYRLISQAAEELLKKLFQKDTATKL